MTNLNLPPDLKGLNVHFQQLVVIAAHIRCKLFELLRDMVMDRASVTWLWDVVSQETRTRATCGPAGL